MNKRERNLFDTIVKVVSGRFAVYNGKAPKRRRIKVRETVNPQYSDSTGKKMKEGEDEYPPQSPWSGHKIGVAYPLVGKPFITKITEAISIISGTLWKKGQSMPPTKNDGDFVERFPTHTQRVVSEDGDYIIKARGLTITVKDAPLASNGRADQKAGEKEIAIEAANGSLIKMTANGDITIIPSATAKVRLGSASTLPDQGVVRKKDISKMQIIPYMNADMVVTSPPIVFGSSNVEASD